MWVIHFHHCSYCFSVDYIPTFYWCVNVLEAVRTKIETAGDLSMKKLYRHIFLLNSLSKGIIFSQASLCFDLFDPTASVSFPAVRLSSPIAVSVWTTCWRRKVVTLQVHENLEVKMPRARDHEAVETARDVLDLCGVQAVSNQAAADLRSVMDTPHFKVRQYLFSLLLLIIIFVFTSFVNHN